MAHVAWLLSLDASVCICWGATVWIDHCIFSLGEEEGGLFVMGDCGRSHYRQSFAGLTWAQVPISELCVCKSLNHFCFTSFFFSLYTSISLMEPHLPVVFFWLLCFGGFVLLNCPFQCAESSPRKFPYSGVRLKPYPQDLNAFWVICATSFFYMWIASFFCAFI